MNEGWETCSTSLGRRTFLSRGAATLEDLPQGAVLGTASLRRQAQSLHRRPDLKVQLLRGNVDTRLAKLEAGEADAILLAYAGLRATVYREHGSGVASLPA